MSRIRKKRKPDTVRLNLVSSRGTNRGQQFKITRLSLPLVQSASRASTTTCSDGADHGEEEHFPEEMDDLYLHRDSEPSTSSASQCSKHRSHESREEKAAESWAKLRTGLLTSLIESSNNSMDVQCYLCSTQLSPVYCQDCGAYMCIGCAQTLHTNINIFHSLVVWKENVYTSLPLPLCTLFIKNHHCTTTYYRDITCIGGLGSQRKVRFQFCDCYSEADTLIKLGYFAATPQRPQVAFQFQLLDLLEALLLECQVAVKDFTTALACLSRCPLQLKEKKDVNFYKVLLNSFEEYRFLKNELRHLRVVCAEHSDGTQCPACPKSGFSPILAIDGHFGLCRKKSAGKSVRPPLHDGVYFEPQKKVDTFVSSYSVGKASTTKECNEFLAGNLLRSNTRYKVLDETGVMGIVCRHEFPYRLYNLRHGERISYIVYALEMIKERSTSHSQVLLLYDVACLLKRHLQGKERNDLLTFFRLAVPVFHSYGHKVDCQLLMNPRNKDGFALSDGEVCERLWSFMRRFSRMTKEMRPAHRIDVLTDALLHFARLTVVSLRTLLPKRLARAEKTVVESQKQLSELFINSPVNFGEQEILEWLDGEQRVQRHVVSDSTSEQMKVFEKLGITARERWYMLVLKAKFAEGHNMASRLSRSITAESKKLRSLLVEYNSMVSPEDQLSWEDITNMSSPIWLTPLQEDSLVVPRSVRLAAIDALMKEKRAIEERDLLKREMENVLHFHLQQHTILATSISQLQSLPSAFNRGAVCLLKIRQHHYEEEIKACIKSFPKSIKVPEIPFPVDDPTLDSQCPTLVPPNETESSDSDGDEDYTRLFHKNVPSDSSEDSQSDDGQYSDSPVAQSVLPDCRALRTSNHNPLLQGYTHAHNPIHLAEKLTTTEPSIGRKSEASAHTLLGKKWQSSGHSTPPTEQCTYTGGATHVVEPLLMAKQDSTTKGVAVSGQHQSESESDSGDEEFEFARDRARLVKEKLEREEFVQGIRMKELEDIVATERKATLNKIVTCTETPVCSGSRSASEERLYPPPKRTMYLHRSKDHLERIVRLSRENMQRERAAERIAKGPYFKKKH